MEKPSHWWLILFFVNTSKKELIKHKTHGWFATVTGREQISHSVFPLPLMCKAGFGMEGGQDSETGDWLTSMDSNAT